MILRWITAWFVILASARGACAQGIDLDVDDPASLKKAAANAAANMMKTYTGNQPGQIPGLLPWPPYFWWFSGAMWGQLIHYWYLTGDDQYNDIVKESLLFQVGADSNYMPANQTADLGNDDQVFWGFSAMDAAEYNFSNPNSDISWLGLAQAVFNTQAPRWDNTTCGGGMRWQIFSYNAGWDYKNTISNGGFFQLAARLAHYTGNETYADWADTAWDWLWQSPMMNQTYEVWDGTYVSQDCKGSVHTYYSYNVATLIMGSAYMYDYTNGSSIWKDRVEGLLNYSEVYFVQSAGANKPPTKPPVNGTIMSEIECEFGQPETCDLDSTSFKAYFVHWLAVTAQLVPSTATFIAPRLRDSAKGAAMSCSGSSAKGTNLCGRRWYQNSWDGYNGVGEQMTALSVFQNNLILLGLGNSSIGSTPGANVTNGKPLTGHSGGSSKGHPGAGSGIGPGNTLINDPLYTRIMTSSDKAGAGVLTLIAIAFPVWGLLWMCF